VSSADPDLDDPEDHDDPQVPPKPPGEVRVGFALGFVAMAPLLLAYEWSLESGADASRSTAELIALRILTLFGPLETNLRWALLALAFAWSLAHVLRRHLGVGPAATRVALEGLALALLLGPALVGLHHLLEIAPPPLTEPAAAPRAVRCGFVLGIAAWEELLFRVGAYSALYLLTRWVASFLGLGLRVARLCGEVVGLLGSATLFAAAHLELFTRWLGPGGEPYEPSVFTWRLLAGILLGLVFRWRGPGVAAWTHGAFNVALLLGAGPDVFLSRT